MRGTHLPLHACVRQRRLTRQAVAHPAALPGVPMWWLPHRFGTSTRRAGGCRGGCPGGACLPQVPVPGAAGQQRARGRSLPVLTCK